MTKPFFSIIIPALNEEKYLPNLLQDLASQSYRDFEVIVVDGKSIDKTVREAKKFARSLPKLTILTSTHRHVCTQRNLGASKAKGDYFVFMDADDRLPPYFLLGLKYKLESEPSKLATTFLSTSSPSVYEIAVINALNTATELSKEIETPVFIEAMTIVSSTLFYKIGGFNENVDFYESKSLIDHARKLGITHVVYRDPRYDFSLRRIRQHGVLKIAAAVGRNQLSILMGEKTTNAKVKNLYPMKGGSLFQTLPTSRSKKFTRSIDKLLHNFYINDKPLTLKKLKKQLNSLLS